MGLTPPEHGAFPLLDIEVAADIPPYAIQGPHYKPSAAAIVSTEYGWLREPIWLPPVEARALAENGTLEHILQGAESSVEIDGVTVFFYLLRT